MCLLLIVYSSMKGRIVLFAVANCWSPARLISESKWPEFATIAPDFMICMWWVSMTCLFPVTVIKRSPNGAASIMGMTLNPS